MPTYQSDINPALQFKAAFDRDYDKAKKAFEDIKATFLKNAEANPANAIEWGGSVVEAQHCYRAWHHAKTAIERHGATRFTVQAVIDEFRRVALFFADGAASSSEIANGVERYAVHGSLKAARDLEYLLPLLGGDA